MRDHDLIKRTHTQGILRPQGRAGDEWESSIYVFEGKSTGDRNADQKSAMNMTLRPGEALVWRWGHTEPAKFFGFKEHKFADRICNGLWEYRPDFSQETWRKGADSVQAIVCGRRRLASRGRQDRRDRVDDPRALCDGRRTGSRSREPRPNSRFPGTARPGKAPAAISMRSFPPSGTARYSYHLRCRLAGAARLRKPGDRERSADGPAVAARDGRRREPVHLLR